MKNSLMTKNNTITMWTTQAQIVLDTLERDGVYYVKKEYIDKKYGKTAWIFKTAYEFFRQHAKDIVPKPEEAESPVWMFRDSKWAGEYEGATCLKLEIPAEELILFDLRDWTRILSLEPIGSEDERVAIEWELKRQGIMTASDVFEKPFYPLLKQRIQKHGINYLRKKKSKRVYSGCHMVIEKRVDCRSIIFCFVSE